MCHVHPELTSLPSILFLVGALHRLSGSVGAVEFDVGSGITVDRKLKFVHFFPVHI